MYIYTYNHIYIYVYNIYIYMICIYICKRDLSVLFDRLTNPHSKKTIKIHLLYLLLRFPENKENKYIHSLCTLFTF